MKYEELKYNAAYMNEKGEQSIDTFKLDNFRKKQL